MPGPTVKVPIGDWLIHVQNACADQLQDQFGPDELARLKDGQDKMAFGGYLMGTSDQAGEVKGLLESAHLGDRKVPIPQAAPTRPMPQGPKATHHR